MPSSVCPRLQFCTPQNPPQTPSQNSPQNKVQSTAPAQRIRLAVFDARVPNVDTLLAGLQTGVRPFVMAIEKDGIAQISEVLQLLPVHELEIVASGFRGGIRLGSTTLTISTLNQYEHQLRGWFANVNSPELSLLTSNIASGKAGSEFIEQLRDITGATVRASAQQIGQGHWLTATAKTFKPLVLNTYSATI